MGSEIEICIKSVALQQAAKEGMDAFIDVFVQAYATSVGGELNVNALEKLNSDQISLWAYIILRDELMTGGFVQLIHNGYGSFFFENPFAKVMRLWGLRDFSKLIYKAREYYIKYKDELTQDLNEEEFMALFERFPVFDELDDQFVENEEEITAAIAHYVDDNIENFAKIVD